MPKVDPTTGQPVSDAPDQEDQEAAGGEGYGGDSGQTVDSGVSTTPDNTREAQSGAGSSGGDPGSTDAGSAS